MSVSVDIDSSSSKSLKYSIPKLREDNYENWSWLCQQVLEEQGVWKYVDPEVKEEDLLSETEESEKRKHEGLALRIIGMSVTERYLGMVRRAKTARNAWRVLQEELQSHSEQQRARYYQQLFNIEQGTKTLNQYHEAFDELVEKITICGGKEPEMEIKRQIYLKGLGAELKEWTTTNWLRLARESMVDIRSEVKMQYDLIRQPKQQSSSTSATTQPHPTALNSNANGHANGNGGNKKKKRAPRKPKERPACYFCGSPDHFIGDCKDKKQQDAATKAKAESANSIFGQAKLGSVVGDIEVSHPVVGLNISCDPRAASPKTNYIIDSGATHHLSGEMDQFVRYLQLKNPITVRGIKSFTAEAIGIGDINIVDDLGNERIFTNVIYVPGLSPGLLSVSRLTKSGFTVTFDEHKCGVSHDDFKIIAPESNGLYEWSASTISAFGATVYATSVKTPLKVWHERYGHVSRDTIEKMARDGSVEGLDVESDPEGVSKICDGCQLGKHVRNPFYPSTTKTTAPLQVIHSDLSGEIQVPSIGGKKYWCTFIDDYTRYGYVVFLKEKSSIEILNAFRDYQSWAERQTGFKIKALRTDGGTEYLGVMMQYLFETGIQHQANTPYSPQSNGLAERYNRSIMDMVRPMMLQSGVPKECWAEAVSTAVYLKNRTLTSALTDGKTPYEKFFGMKPKVGHLRVFGTVVYRHIPKERRQKLDAKSMRGLLVGYDIANGAYRIFHPQNKTVYTSRDVYIPEEFDSELTKAVLREYRPEEPPAFVEPSFYGNEVGNAEVLETVDAEVTAPPPGTQLPNPESAAPEGVLPLNVNARNENQIQHPAEEVVVDDDDADGPPPLVSDESEDDDEINDEGPPPLEVAVVDDPIVIAPPAPPQIRRELPARTRRAPDRYEGLYVRGFAVRAVHSEFPRTYHEAMQRDDSTEWQAACQREYNSLQKNKTYILVPKPAGKPVVSTKWVLEIKDTGLYKGRFVARGFTQREGVNYDETFAPVVKHESIRIFVSIWAGVPGREIHQMDVCTAFMYGYLEEEIYITQPEGFEVKGKEDWVCRLLRSLNGLKQSARVWYEDIRPTFERMGFKCLITDSGVFILEDPRSPGKIVASILLYVDDLLIGSASKQIIAEIKKQMCIKYDMKDMGIAKKFIGLEIMDVDVDDGGNVVESGSGVRSGIGIHMSDYIAKVLERYGMGDCRSISTPMDPGLKLYKFREGIDEETDTNLYRSLIGSLNYAACLGRPDISRSVNALARYMSRPSTIHLLAAKRILRYLNGTRRYGIVYSQNQKLICYTDADYAGDLDTRRSTTGSLHILNGGIVSWQSRSQPTVALSTTEAEYMAVCDGVKSSKFLIQFLREIGAKDRVELPLIHGSDNQGAIALAENPVLHSRTKHIDIRYHFIRDALKNGDTVLKYIPTDEMPADVLTKALTADKHQKCCDMMGMRLL